MNARLRGSPSLLQEDEAGIERLHRPSAYSPCCSRRGSATFTWRLTAMVATVARLSSGREPHGKLTH